jgi:ornithine cyclodeaminase/alanine dehydrogenase-like protein (mu-crystallin family)
LARKDSQVLGILGTGPQAKALVEAVSLVRPLKTVKVFSRTAAKREMFARDFEDSNLDIVSVIEPKTAVRHSDVVGLATNNNTMNPIVFADWFSEGTHINAIGAVGKGRVELDDTIFQRSSKVVVDSLEECLQGSQEIINAIEAGVLDKDQLIELSDIISGKEKGRVSPDEITLFKSQGSGFQDVIIASKVYKLAKEEGLGKEIGEIGKALRVPKKRYT